jgi:uncharacterized low-complexity protein
MEKKTSLITRSMLAGALMSLSSAQANALLEYNALGSAGSVRSVLIKTIEANCGEKKAENKTNVSSDAKTKEAKCGEKKAKDAKCGEKKAKDGKCGEGKCGEKKGEKKSDKPK